MVCLCFLQIHFFIVLLLDYLTHISAVKALAMRQLEKYSNNSIPGHVRDSNGPTLTGQQMVSSSSKLDQ